MAAGSGLICPRQPMSNHTQTILLIEDNENDVLFMRRALKTAEVLNPLQVVTDGQQALNYFAGVGHFSDRQRFPLPILVFLDLKLPHRDGLEVLQWLRKQTGLNPPVVLVLTTSKEPNDIRKAFNLGANAYLTKPSSVSQLYEMMKAVKYFWLEFNQFC
jgi:CheY-like chemotaxis protein